MMTKGIDFTSKIANECGIPGIMETETEDEFRTRVSEVLRNQRDFISAYEAENNTYFADKDGDKFPSVQLEGEDNNL